MGLPFGECGIRDPMLEVRSRQLRWLQELANTNNIVGRLHRALATWFGSWHRLWFEPTMSLRSAITSFGWDVRVRDFPFPSCWPSLSEDPHLVARVVISPSSEPIPQGAFFTDGSIGTHGGGAASVALEPTPAFGCGSRVHIAHPRSMTQCELIGIKMAARSNATAIFSDSLSSLLLLRDWGKWSLSRKLKCVDRAEVRATLSAASGGQLLLLEKVKAHRTDPVAGTDPKVVWNNAADTEAKAATNEGNAHACSEELQFADQVSVLDETGKWIFHLPSALSARWWSLERRKMAQRRPDTLGVLYPSDVEFDWASSNRAFRAPFVRGGKWVYLVSRLALKWAARARCGALASTARRAKTDGRASGL